MAETEKKTTAKKTTKRTSKKSTTKAKEEKMTINDIPSDLLEELTKQITQNIMSTLNVETKSDTIENNNISTKKTDSKYTKADLYKIKETTSEPIAIRSIREGVVNFFSRKTNTLWSWREKGEVEYMPLSEVMNMEASSKRFLHTPWLMVDDIRVIQAFGLEDLYDMIEEVNDLDSFLEGELSHIISVVERLSPEFKDGLASDINKRLNDKTIKIDYLVLKELEKLLQYNFN